MFTLLYRTSKERGGMNCWKARIDERKRAREEKTGGTAYAETQTIHNFRKRRGKIRCEHGTIAPYWKGRGVWGTGGFHDWAVKLRWTRKKGGGSG